MSEENKIPPEEIPQEQPGENILPTHGVLRTGQAGSSDKPIPESEELSTPSDQVIRVGINYQPSTDQDMEVHHHTHPTSGRTHENKHGKIISGNF